MNLVETYKDEIIGYREQRPRLSFRVIVDKLFQDHGACIRFFSYLSIIYTNQYSCTTLKNAVHIWIGDETDDTSLNTPPRQTTQPHNTPRTRRRAETRAAHNILTDSPQRRRRRPIAPAVPLPPPPQPILRPQPARRRLLARQPLNPLMNVAHSLGPMTYVYRVLLLHLSY